jgi:putative transposase
MAVARKPVARLMCGAGLRGISRRRFPTTTQREPSHRPANDLVGRDFRAVGPNRLWVADITYMPTAAGFLFLAVVLDVWSRRIVGWAMATDLRTRLVLDALHMAVTTRKPADVYSGDGMTTAEVYAFVRRAGAGRAIAVNGQDGLGWPLPGMLACRRWPES